MTTYSYFMAVCAPVILWSGTPEGVIVVVGVAWLAIGLAICIAWRGSHRGSYMLMAAGLFALIGSLS